MRVSMLIALLCLSASSCGKPLVDEAYQGVPMLSFEGQIYNFYGETSAGEGQIRPGLFWSDRIEVIGKPADLVAEGVLKEDNTIEVAIDFPSTFRVNIFRTPPPSWWIKDKPFAVGFILLYRDKGATKSYDTTSGETMVGQAYLKAVLYASEDLSAALSPINMPIKKGMYLIDYPVECAASGQEANDGSQTPCADVNLGAACDSDAACGDKGTCLKEHDGLPLVGGYCVLREEEATDCVPEKAVLLYGYSNDDSMYFKSCEGPSDCRQSDGYTCVPGQYYCYPSYPVQLEIDPNWVSVSPLCIEHVCSICGEYVMGSTIQITEDCACQCLEGSTVECDTSDCQKAYDALFEIDGGCELSYDGNGY